MITDPDFEFLRQLVYDQSSIHLGAEKKAMVCTRLNPRLSHLGLESVEEYCELLRTKPEREEITHLIDALSTNFTTFFREIDHFKFLKDEIIPEFLCGEFGATRGPFRAWSAACSTGEEAYSMAIVLAEGFGGIDRGSWEIFASDISQRVLKKAAQGIYEQGRVKLPNPGWLAQYFQRGQGEWEGHYRVKQALREQVRFGHMNLLQPGLHLRERYHVIFCRNVTIYFDQPTVERLAERLCHQLHEGGYLIVGHAESLLPRPRGLQTVKASIFRKVSR